MFDGAEPEISTTGSAGAFLTYLEVKMLTALGNINLILRGWSRGSITSAQFNLQRNCFTDFTCRVTHKRGQRGSIFVVSRSRFLKLTDTLKSQ